MPVRWYIEPNDRSRYYYFDDFGGGDYDKRTWGYGWDTGGSVIKIPGLGGQIRLTVSDVADRECYITQDMSNFRLPLACRWRGKIETTSENLSAQFGFQADSTHYIQMHANSAVSAYWLCRCYDGGSYTNVVSSLPVDTDWHEILITGTSSEVLFFVDNNIIGTITTNIPTGDQHPLVYLYRHTGGTGTRSVLIDWIEISGQRY